MADLFHDGPNLVYRTKESPESFPSMRWFAQLCGYADNGKLELCTLGFGASEQEAIGDAFVKHASHITGAVKSDTPFINPTEFGYSPPLRDAQ